MASTSAIASGLIERLLRRSGASAGISPGMPHSSRKSSTTSPLVIASGSKMRGSIASSPNTTAQRRSNAA